jgi:broad specificity phosphatase PhoE
MKILKVLVALICLFLFVACQQKKEQTNSNKGNTTIIFIRHAEKASDEADSPLSEEGIKRSQALVQVLEHTKIDAIYSSQFKRNLDTVSPLATLSKVVVATMPVDIKTPNNYSELLIKEILLKYQGKTILVVGHTNTIPSAIDILMDKIEIKTIAYYDLFIVTILSNGQASLLRAQYGSKLS